MIIKPPHDRRIDPLAERKSALSKRKGDQPVWSPSVISGIHSDEEQSEDQTEEKHEEGAETEDSEQAPRSFADRLPNLKIP